MKKILFAVLITLAGCSGDDGSSVTSKVASDECQKTSDCRAGFICAGIKDKVRYACVDPASALCRRKTACKDKGECTADKDGNCVASEADCRASANCRKEGHCSIENGSCTPAQDSDCRGSAACRARGKCTFTKILSPLDGLRLGICSATSQKDCQSSSECAEKGKCAVPTVSLVKEDGIMALWKKRYPKHLPSETLKIYSCVVGSDSDCQQSKLCQKMGRCRAEKLFCVK